MSGDDMTQSGAKLYAKDLKVHLETLNDQQRLQTFHTALFQYIFKMRPYVILLEHLVEDTKINDPDCLDQLVALSADSELDLLQLVKDLDENSRNIRDVLDLFLEVAGSNRQA